MSTAVPSTEAAAAAAQAAKDAAALRRDISALETRRAALNTAAADNANRARFADAVADTLEALAADATKVAGACTQRAGDTLWGLFSGSAKPVATATASVGAVGEVVEGGWTGDAADAFVRGARMIPESVTNQTDRVDKWYRSSATECRELATRATAKAVEFRGIAVVARRNAAMQLENAIVAGRQIASLDARADKLDVTASSV